MIHCLTNRDRRGRDFGGDLGPLCGILGCVDVVELPDLVSRVTSDIARQRASGVEEPAVIFFWHGYNTTHAEAVAAAGRFAAHFEAHRRDPIVILCSWPSEGNALAYTADLGEIGAAALGFAEALGLAAQIAMERTPQGKCPAQLILAGHSMGCAVLAQTVARLWKAMEKPDRVPVFSEIVLMGADLDDNSLEVGKIGEGLIRLARRVTIYRNAGDAALRISAKARAGMSGPRLGRQGPADLYRMPYSQSVAVVDCTAVARGEGGSHSFYLYGDSPEFRADLRAVVAGDSRESISGREQVGQHWRLLPAGRP